MIGFVLPTGAAKKLLKDLQEDNSNVSLCDLCKAHVVKGDDVTKFKFFCFDLGEDAEEMLDQFQVMMKTVKPNLICKLWDTAVEEQLNSGKNSPDLTFREVYIRIWRPSYQECQNTIEQLSSLQLPLHKVKEYFFSYDVQKKLEEELNKLCNAINICQKSSSQAFIKTSWIRDASYRIFTYKQLCQYGGAAETFLKLRDTLGLTGDFVVVETLIKAVSTSLFFSSLTNSAFKVELGLILHSCNLSIHITLGYSACLACAFQRGQSWEFSISAAMRHGKSK